VICSYYATDSQTQYLKSPTPEPHFVFSGSLQPDASGHVQVVQVLYFEKSL
jgi:hypothetical protein